EAQVVLPLISEGLTDCLWKVARGERPSRVDYNRGAAVNTVLASRGYPDRPEKGAPIRLPEGLPEGVTLFAAGTTRPRVGVLRVDGGRVLSATAASPSFAEAQRLSREAAEAVQFEGKV